MHVDAVIFGGGVAGLWTLDRLVRQGCHAVLLESRALGFGQTVASQGIIHGGMKYSLHGWLSKSAQHIRKMPEIWQQALLGRTAPNLTNTRLRSPACYLWQTESLASMAGMLGARIGLQVTPEPVPDDDRPAVFAQVTGSLSRLPEQVIDPASFLTDLAAQHRDRLLLIDPSDDGLRFELTSPGEVIRIHLTCPETGKTLSLKPEQVLLTAGAGNARLRKLVGLSADVMQRRPLHMVLARGDLPELHGHCIDGLKTRVTVTSTVDNDNRMVWQIGGQVAEDGVRMTPQQLTDHAARELQAVLPQLDFTNVEWSSYTIDRAEAQTEGNTRPETIQVLCAGNVTTGWPTKLALAPLLAEEMAARVQPIVAEANRIMQPLIAWPKPPVAEYAWNETERAWWPVDLAPRQFAPQRRAA
ncbi:FAD-dependent oxidoreductase [bacterium]|nr:FAD-dependent oxidoreductase [bacterium]